MTRTRQIPRQEVPDRVLPIYQRLFGDRDPVAEPGTATGTPGNWWTVFAQAPDLLDHMVAGFALFSSPDRELPPDLRELALTRDLALGDTTLVRRGRRLVAFALWHSAPLAAGRPRDEVRLLKLAALDLEAFSALLDAVQAAAGGERLRRLSVRCQSAFGDAYAQLIRDGFRVHWTDLRMTLGGYPEAPVRQGSGVADRGVIRPLPRLRGRKGHEGPMWTVR